MNADKFSELVRNGNGSVRVTHAILHAEGQKVRGDGILIIFSDRLEFEMHVRTVSAMPFSRRTFWHESDFWSLSGRIDGDLPFTCQRVSPRGRTDSWGNGKARTFQNLELSHLLLKPPKGHGLSSAQRRKLNISFPKVEFHAVLIGCQKVFINAGTKRTTENMFLGKTERQSADTFIDRSYDYDFALIQKDDDLHVHLRSKAEFRSKNEKDDRRRFLALLQAIAFTHGFHTWPFRLTYRRNGLIVSDTISASRSLVKTIHAPFDAGLGRQLPSQGKTRPKSPIRIAARFFQKETALSTKLGELLVLLRAGGAMSVDMRIRTLALCSLFEGVVDLLFDTLNLEKEVKGIDPHFDSYIRLRDRLASRLIFFASPQNTVLKRLAGSIRHAKAFRVKDKFKALCMHFGLDYAVMKKHFDSWHARRNPLSHGEWDSEIEDFIHESRIAGAINILVLKAMGFSGRVRAVAIGEDSSETYRVI